MTLQNYFKNNDILKTDFAKTIGVSKSYLSQILTGHRNAGLSLSLEIERATKGKVTCRDMAKQKAGGF